MMEMTLRGANYEPLTATDGEGGLKFLLPIRLIW